MSCCLKIWRIAAEDVILRHITSRKNKRKGAKASLLFLTMISTETFEQLDALIQGIMPEAFLVDAQLSTVPEGRASGMLRLKVDTDTGISLDETRLLTRELGRKLAENDLFDVGDYGVEIGSPGVGSVLKLRRQYKKEIGRNLRIIRNDGTDFTATLTRISESQLTFTPLRDTKGRKDVANVKQAKQPQPLIEITFDDIKEAKVVFV